MGSKYKAALIPRRIRETIHGWGKATRKKRRRRRGAWDDSTVRTETSTVCSLTDEDDDDLDDHHHGPFEETPRTARGPPPYLKVELQQTQHGPFRAGTPCFHPVAMPGSSSSTHHGGGSSSSHPMLLRQPSSASAPSSPSYRGGNVTRSASMPGISSLRTGAGTPTHMGHDESS
jgi:mlo protein